jgi:serine/threonine-protein kinase RsbW
MSTIHINIPSLAENIRVVESFIDNAKEKFSLNDDIYGNIMIAVTESVNNAIKHGNNFNKHKNVSLSLFLDDEIIRFIIRDEGSGFDFTSLPDPTAPENIKQPGGRGIFLMKNLSDEVHFTEEGKVVELLFYLS